METEGVLASPMVFLSVMILSVKILSVKILSGVYVSAMMLTVTRIHSSNVSATQYSRHSKGALGVYRLEPDQSMSLVRHRHLMQVTSSWCCHFVLQSPHEPLTCTNI